MNPLTILSLVSLAPAAVILYLILGHFEGYFKDNKAFFMIILGMGIGIVMGIFSSFLIIVNFLLMIAVIFLIELIKMVVLLQKPFRLNFDTTFYGLGLGTGLGATFVFINSFYAGLTSLTLRTSVFILLLSLNYTAINASTGALLGYGSYQGEFWKYFFRAFILHGILGFMLTFIYGGISQTGAFAILIIGSIYNLLLIMYIYNNILKKTIPKDMKKVKKLLES